MSWHEVEKLSQVLKSSDSVAVLSGAGLSAESGLSTFRGEGGLWKNRNPIELATPEAFQNDPALVWEFYNWRREKALAATPNPAHYALAEIEKQVEDFINITQNVDRLSHRAGGEKIIEIHGNLFDTICFDCRKKAEGLPDIVVHPTHCKYCGGLVRPGVVWFNEPVPVYQKAARMVQSVDLLLVIGTSALVQPAASLAMIAKQGGSLVCELNIEATPLTDQLDLAIHGPAGESLPKAVELAYKRESRTDLSS